MSSFTLSDTDLSVVASFLELLAMSTEPRPDIRALTGLVPRSGNLIQGQSELTINRALAEEAASRIAASENHYSAAEGDPELRRAVAEKIATLNGITVDPHPKAQELLITSGATGGLVAVAQTYLQRKTALVFEPYYPYHRLVVNELGGRTEVFPMNGERLELDRDELSLRCEELITRAKFPLTAIILCNPSNPAGKVFTLAELEQIARVCQQLDLLCIVDEVYEHHVMGDQSHISIARLPGMWERTITVNSFSKSWNISGWRLGYCYGDRKLIASLYPAINILYVCPPTPLQRGLAMVLMNDGDYYRKLRESFMAKRRFAVTALEEVGFRTYESTSSFYVWAQIPKGYGDAMDLNEVLINRVGVGAVPGNAFAQGDDWDSYMRFCIAREDDVLLGALEKLQSALR